MMSTLHHVSLVRLHRVVVAFGGLRALNEIDLEVASGERLAILGPNGAGKTTLFNVVAGDVPVTEGTVEIKGLDCTLYPSRVRPRLDVARTYQKTRLFNGLTVTENLVLAQTGRWGPRLRPWRRRSDAVFKERAREVAASVWLGSVADSMVGDLSHGQLRQLEVAMAMVTNPSLLLLDEPASGLSRGERKRLVELLEGLPADVTLVLIEHDMEVALKVAERVVVMSDGRIVAEGSPEDIRADPLVHEIYLGSQEQSRNREQQVAVDGNQRGSS